MPPRLRAVSVAPLRRPNRTSANGCIRFDRDLTRLGVGRIQLSSGTENPDEFDRRNGIITKLVEDGDVDTLRALRHGEISIQELVAAFRKGRLASALEEARAARTRAASKPSIISTSDASHGIISMTSPRPTGAASIDLDLATRVGMLVLDGLAGSSSGGTSGTHLRALCDLLGLQLSDATPAARTLVAELTSGMAAIENASAASVCAPLSARGPHLVTVHGPQPGYEEETFPLWSTLIDQVVPSLDCGPETRRRYATSLEALRRKMRQYARDEDLEKLRPAGSDTEQPIRYDRLAVEVFHAISGDGKVGDLRKVNRWFWKSLAAQWNNSPADWNHVRRGLAASLTGLFSGDAKHPFRQAIIEAMPLSDEGEGRTPDLTVEKFWEVVDNLPEHMRAVPVVLVATGMRMKEYLATGHQHLKPNIYAVEIPGTKTATRQGIGSKSTVMVDEDIWPWIEAGIPAPHKYKRIWQHWTEACTKAGLHDVHLHDLRHCLGQWATDAGVPEKHVQWAMRHRDPNMTRRYTRTAGKREVAAAMGKVLQRD